MDRYYFFSKSENRELDKKLGIISFRLQALYAENAYDQRLQKEVRTFHYFDQIEIYVNTKVKGVYRFNFDTGVDGCMSAGVTSLKELLQNMTKSFVRISERNYFLLRSTAIGLMFRHTEFFNSIKQGTSKYGYGRRYNNSFHDVEIAVFNYQYNRGKASEEHLNWMKEVNIKPYDVDTLEGIKIFSHKNKPNERPYHTHTFTISSNVWGTKHTSFKQAYKSTFYRDYEVSKVSLRQYQRLRKVLMAIIFHASDLDISKIRPEQNHRVTILDL